MKPILRMLGFVLVFFMSPCFALSSQIDASGLNDQQRAALIKQVEDLKAQAGTPQQQAANTVETVRSWAGLGKELGIGLAETAKQLGIAANEFANTPIGQLTSAIIVWKMIGKSIVLLALGCTLLFIVLPVWMWFWAVRARCYEKVPTGTWLWGAFPSYTRQYRGFDAESMPGMMVWMFGTLIAVVGIAFICNV